MAKGKQAALAAVRRYESAIEHIDRLTSELVDAKLRARQHEAATVQLPVLQAEVARLRQQVSDGTSDKLEQAEARHTKAMKDIQAENTEFRDAIIEILTHVREGHRACIPASAELLLSRTGVIDSFDNPNRQLRRARTFGRTAADLHEHDLQDNRRTQHENDAINMGIKERSPTTVYPIPDEQASA